MLTWTYGPLGFLCHHVCVPVKQKVHSNWNFSVFLNTLIIFQWTASTLFIFMMKRNNYFNFLFQYHFRYNNIQGLLKLDQRTIFPKPDS